MAEWTMMGLYEIVLGRVTASLLSVANLRPQTCLRANVYQSLGSLGNFMELKKKMIIQLN